MTDINLTLGARGASEGRCSSIGSPSVADMRAFIESEISRWGEVVRKAGIAQSQE